MACPDCPPRPRLARWLVAAVIGLGLLGVLLGELWADRRSERRSRRGRVERVERPRFAAATQVRICALMPPEDHVTCYGGTPPPAGTAMHLVDDQGYRVLARTTRSEPSSSDQCRLGSMYDVYLELDGGVMPPRPGYSSTWAVQGAEVAPTGKYLTDPNLRSPSGRDVDTMWVSVDRDGDGRVDLAATWSDCTAEVTDAPRPPGGQVVQVFCMGYWIEDGGAWKQANREFYYGCR